MVQWVTGAEILAHVGAGTGSPEEQAWAELCAAAVSSGIDARLAGAAMSDPFDPADAPELVRAARVAGGNAYKAREAALDGSRTVDAIAGDYLEPVAGIIARWATTGIS